MENGAFLIAQNEVIHMSDNETDSDPFDRVHRAFRRDDSFETAGDDTWRALTTDFDATVAAEPADETGVEIRFFVAVDLPMLSTVTAEHVAAVVETGWAETFERRVVDVGSVTRRERSFDPTVERDEETITVQFDLTDSNERRGLEDARAVIDFVEGTYVQGIIPGYEYTGVVDELISAARQQGGGSPF